MNTFFDKSSNLVATFVTIIALPFIDYMYGGHVMTVPLISIFTTLILLDWLSGVAASHKQGTYSSKYGLNGAIRTVFLYGMLALGHQIDAAFTSEPWIFIVAWVLITFPTAQSVAANAVILGWESHIRVDFIQKILTVLEKWAQSEIEYKMARSKNRLEEKESAKEAIQELKEEVRNE